MHIGEHFTNLKQWQAKGLALFSFGVVLAQHCQSSQVAEALAGLSRIPTLERRLRRWLANPRIKLEACWEAWVGWVWANCHLPRAVLLVDETKLTDRLGVMMVSLAYEKRAIPLVWSCYRANSALDYPGQGQVLLVWGLLARVLNILPAESRPLVQMDRGLGHSSAMLRALHNLGVTYQVRVKQSATLRSRRGKCHALRDLVKYGETLTCRGTLFQGAKGVTVTVHLIWQTGYAQPWCLVTNDRRIPGSAYALRVWQEESFRDLKSGGWQWQCSHVTTPAHAQRLILVLAVAYAWMLTQGTLVFQAGPALQREIFEGRTNKYSLFRTGLRFFKRMVHVKPAHIVMGLCFTPLHNPVFAKVSSP
jgi:hypothetical protein